MKILIPFWVNLNKQGKTPTIMSEMAYIFAVCGYCLEGFKAARRAESDCLSRTVVVGSFRSRKIKLLIS